MRINRILRIGFLVLLFSAALGIAWSLVWRGLLAPETGRSAELLSPDIQQRSTDFLHSEFKLDRLMFRVQASSHALSSEGIENLEDVRLVLYGEDGEPSDVVSGRKAVFQVATKRIEFSGDVETRLSDGTQIRCGTLEADLDREEIWIREAFQFTRGSAAGSAGRLLYRIPLKLLELSGGFAVAARGEGTPLEASGLRGIYDLGRQRFSLANEASMMRGRYQLKAEEMELWLRGSTGLERLTAHGQARFSTGNSVFEGREILGVFNDSGELTDFQVLSGNLQESNSRRASFRHYHPGGEDHLEADRIAGEPLATQAGASQDLLREFEAYGSVSFRSPRLRVEEAKSDFLRGRMNSSGAMESLELRAGVEVRRRSLEGGSEWLKSGALSMTFDSIGDPQRALATNEVDLGTALQQDQRKMRCARSVEIEFVEGEPGVATGYQDCVADLVGRGENLTIRAPWLRSTYEKGRARAVALRGGVEFESRHGESSRTIRSSGADLTFQKGRLSQVLQRGEVILETGVESGSIQLSGEKAVFDVESGRTVVTGVEKASMVFDPAGQNSGERSVTTAAEFSLDQSGQGVTALREVRTIVEGRNEQLEITAGRMEVETGSGQVEYTGSPKVVTSSTNVTGKKVVSGGEGGLLIIEGEVHSQLALEQEGERGEFVVEAERLTIGLTERRAAMYEGNVRAHSDEFDLMAPFVELLFGPGNRDNKEDMREVQAWGGVEIQEALRKARGERAFYYPSERKVSVIGEPAQILDSKQGRASGYRLIFFLGEERLTVEGAAKSKP